MGLGGLGLGGGGYGGGGYDQDCLYDSMAYVDRDIPLVDAWGMDVGGWGDEQAGLADLLYFQRQLEMNRELDEGERMRRWEERLRWEELGEEERRMRYSTMDPYRLQTLGLSGASLPTRFLVFWQERALIVLSRRMVGTTFRRKERSRPRLPPRRPPLSRTLLRPLQEHLQSLRQHSRRPLLALYLAVPPARSRRRRSYRRSRWWTWVREGVDGVGPSGVWSRRRIIGIWSGLRSQAGELWFEASCQRRIESPSRRASHASSSRRNSRCALSSSPPSRRKLIIFPSFHDWSRAWAARSSSRGRPSNQGRDQPGTSRRSRCVPFVLIGKE